MSYTFTQTGAEIQNILDRVSEYPTLSSTITVTSLPVTVSLTGLTAYHQVIGYTLGTPTAQTDDWTVTTTTGSYTVSGSVSGSTTLTLQFAYFAS